MKTDWGELGWGKVGHNLTTSGTFIGWCAKSFTYLLTG